MYCLAAVCASKAQAVNLPASHHGAPGSDPGQSMWHLWCTKCNWDRFFSKYCSFPLWVSFPVIPPVLCTNLHLPIALTGTHGRNLGTFQKVMLFQKLGRIG